MRIRWMTLILAAGVLSGCAADRGAPSDAPPASPHTRMSFNEVAKAGYVSAGPSGLVNADKLETFYAGYQEKQPSRLTIVRYTDEGDPVYIDLDYDGKAVTYQYDNTWDAFGGQDKGVKRTTCSTLSKRTGSYGTKYGTEYVASGCDADIGYSHPDKTEYQLLFVEEQGEEGAAGSAKENG